MSYIERIKLVRPNTTKDFGTAASQAFLANVVTPEVLSVKVTKSTNGLELYINLEWLTLEDKTTFWEGVEQSVANKAVMTELAAYRAANNIVKTTL
jgi:hypothetical protein